MSVLIIFSLAVLISASFCVASDCGNWMHNYSALEEELLKDREKLVFLEEAFYPTNSHDKVVVGVQYSLEPQRGIEDDDMPVYKLTMLKDTGGGRVLRQVADETTNNSRTPQNLSFGWLNSPVYMFINPQLLTGLSLYTYTTHVLYAVELNFSVPCSIHDLQQLLPNNTKCPSVSPVLDLFNHLTTNLQSYVLHRSSAMVDGFPEDKEKGLSVYYYDINKPSGYCILDKEGKYNNQRLYLGIGITLLLVFILCAFPLGFIVSFKKFREKIKEETDFRFFVWSFVITSLLVSLPIIAWDIHTFTEHFSYYPGSKVEGKFMYNIHILFVLVATLFVVCLVLDILFTILALRRIYLSNVQEFVKDIPIPRLFQLISKFCCCAGENQDNNQEPHQRDNNQEQNNQEQNRRDNNPPNQRDNDQEHNQAEPNYRKCCFRLCAESIALALGNVIMMVFLQLCGFHLFFITLGILATPVSTISLASFYIAFYFCLMTFLAVLLKVSDAEIRSLHWMIVAWVLTLIVGIIGLVCIGFIVAYFYNYIGMVQDKNYSSGFLVILGRILPTFIMSILAYCGRKLVKYVGLNKNETNTQRGANGQNQEPV